MSLCLSGGLFSSDFKTKMLYAFLISSTCPHVPISSSRVHYYGESFTESSSTIYLFSSTSIITHTTAEILSGIQTFV
jgi:hypothetical protein